MDFNPVHVVVCERDTGNAFRNGGSIVMEQPTINSSYDEVLARAINFNKYGKREISILLPVAVINERSSVPVPITNVLDTARFETHSVTSHLKDIHALLSVCLNEITNPNIKEAVSHWLKKTKSICVSGLITK
jgi:hypothetical protein